MEEQAEPIVCSECCAEPGQVAATQYSLMLEGWDFTGEFGPRCPECVGKNVAPSQSAGLGGMIDTVKEAVDRVGEVVPTAKKARKTKPKKRSKKS